MPALPEPRRPAKRLTKDERAEVREALQRGEKAADLAARYGISRQAVSLIKRALDAESGDPKALAARKRRQSKMRTMKLDTEEWAKLSTILQSSTPLDHHLAKEDDFQPESWNPDRTSKLAKKLFDRTPARGRVIKLLAELFPQPENYPGSKHQKPEPPVRITKAMISPEFRDDPSYVAYVTSETYWKIQQRTYELELAEYERHQAGLPPHSEEHDEPLRPQAPLPARPPAKRRKGPAFTKPKRRKKRK